VHVTLISLASSAVYNMANDGPSARIGVLVEFNYEDLEVLYLGFQAMVVKQDPWYPAPPPLLLPQHTYIQVWYPLLRFREEGMETFTIGPEVGKVYQSKKGYPCKADRDIDSVTSQVYIV